MTTGKRCSHYLKKSGTHPRSRFISVVVLPLLDTVIAETVTTTEEEIVDSIEEETVDSTVEDTIVLLLPVPSLVEELDTGSLFRT